MKPPRRGSVAATAAAAALSVAFLAAALVAVRRIAHWAVVGRPPSGGGGRGRPAAAAAFVLLVGPNSEGSNRTRGLTLALHSLWHNYLAEHPARVVLFYADDVPPEQCSPATLAAVVPPPMARLVEVNSNAPVKAAPPLSSLHGVCASTGTQLVPSTLPRAALCSHGYNSAQVAFDLSRRERVAGA